MKPMTTAGVRTAGAGTGDSAAAGRIGAGTCYAVFAYDVGFSIDLDEAERRVTEATARGVFRHRRRAPRHFEFRPAPLRIIQAAEPISVGGEAGGGGWRTGASVECVLYDFGAVSVTYSLPLGEARDGSGDGPRDLDGLLALSNALYDNEALLADSRRRVERVVAAIGGAVQKPQMADLVEDYVIYQISEVAGLAAGEPVSRWVDRHASRIAQVLRSESGELSAQEAAEALSARCSYSPSDEAVIDWNAAVLLMDDAEEVKAVLEFANVELLEVRFLDDMLDRALERGYAAMERESRRGMLGWGGETASLARLARLQVDSAVLFEGVNNALKLVGDQYLARLYRLAAQRLHLPEWDASILRKLETVESIYQKVHDRQSTRRMELLEWIIIVLIAVSILVMFVPGKGAGGGHAAGRAGEVERRGEGR